MESLFTERLKTTRQAKGLTQEDVANAIQMGKSTFCQYEKGTRKPDIYIIVKIAHYLNVSADFLLGLTDNPNEDLNQPPTAMYPKLSGSIREYFSNDSIPQSEKDSLFKDISSMYWKYKK